MKDIHGSLICSKCEEQMKFASITNAIFIYVIVN